MNSSSNRSADSPPQSAAGRLWTYVPVALGIVISASFLALAVRHVRIYEVARAISEVRLIWFPAIAAVLLGDILVRSVRWHFLLSHASPRATLRQLYEFEAIGLAINNVFFMRIGEVARGCLAARALAIPVLTVFATIFVERMLDLMSLVLLFGVTARWYPVFVEPRLSLIALTVAAGVAVSLIVLARLDGVIHQPVWEGRLGRMPGAYRWIRQAALGTRALRRWSTAVAVVVLGLFLWVLDAGLYWVAGQAMGLNPRLTFGHSVFVLASAAAASFLPAVPGSFGAFEQAVKLLLVRLGIGESAALGFAAFVHVTGYLLVTGLGIVFLYQAGHTLASLKALGKSEPRA